MFASNRSYDPRIQSHITQLWAQLRRDAHAGGGAWLCAYVTSWVETSPEDAVTETLFAGL